MVNKDITSCRGVLEFLKEEDELLITNEEVDPILEVSGITKELDNSLALLFQNLKGYANRRILTGLFSRRERMAKIFGVSDLSKLKFKGLEALKKPVPPRLVDGGPCQEVVITQDIDVLKTIPIIKHTEADAGRILGGGIVLISGPDIGNCISFKRIHFRGGDWASLAFEPGSHFEYWVLEQRKEKRNLPLTINISTSPAVQAVAGAGHMRMAIPVGSDELAIAGGVQGAPVEICKAKTVDAYAIANSEWVIEGYIDTSQLVWESEEAEKRGDFSVPFFPEGSGHMGRARSTYKFQATAITHRKDNPILYAPLAHSFEVPYMASLINDAALYDLLNRQQPGLVIDVNVLPSMIRVVQVHKQRRRDEQYIISLILTTLALSSFPRMVVVVDEDVDIYNADEVMWALNTRVNAKENLILVPPATSLTDTKEMMAGLNVPACRMGFDATVPLEYKREYWRGEFPKVDVERWFSKDQINALRTLQSEYAKVLAQKRA